MLFESISRLHVTSRGQSGREYVGGSSGCNGAKQSCNYVVPASLSRSGPGHRQTTALAYSIISLHDFSPYLFILICFFMSLFVTHLLSAACLVSLLYIGTCLMFTLSYVRIFIICHFSKIIKGALCSFGEEIVIRRDRSILTDAYMWRTLPPLSLQTVFWGPYFPLETAYLREMLLSQYCKFWSLNFLSK